METFARRLFRFVSAALRDLTPLVSVIAFFQIVVLRQPFPNLGEVLVGCVFVILGLTLFVRGLEMGLFPLGEAMAAAFVRKAASPPCWRSPSRSASKPRSPNPR